MKGKSMSESIKCSRDEAFRERSLNGDTFVDAHSLFRGAVVFDGEGVVEVKRVGLKSMMGKMALEMNEDDPAE